MKSDERGRYHQVFRLDVVIFYYTETIICKSGIDIDITVHNKHLHKCKIDAIAQVKGEGDNFQLGGGVRLRSRLSPGGDQNQKVHFKAKTGTFFIISYKLGANHVKSYKKLDRKAQNLEITSFSMGLGPK